MTGLQLKVAKQEHRPTRLLPREVEHMLLLLRGAARPLAVLDWVPQEAELLLRPLRGAMLQLTFQEVQDLQIISHWCPPHR